MYATAAELRTRFRVGLDADEFAHRDDADLEQSLIAASAEIDSWRPASNLVTAANLAVLRDKALILARMMIHQDQALSDEHPVVRDAQEVRRWLRALAAGTVRLPDEAGVSGAPAAPIRKMVYGAEFDSYYLIP
ncbi:MAG: hypothetical protein RL375_490 [Pseudomonadota bacterium]|jgi:phage gp36-like protein